MLSEIDYEVMIEEHGHDNIIIDDRTVSVKFDGRVIENHDWKLPYKPWASKILHGHRIHILNNDEMYVRLSRGEVPQMVNFDNRSWDDMYWLKQACSHSFNMWAIVDMTWTKTLAEKLIGRHCIEICAGRGWLSKALHDHGVDIISTDKTPSKSYTQSNNWEYIDVKAFNVEKLTAEEALSKYADNCDTLICSWPPYETDEKGVLTLAIEQLNQTKNCKIKTIIYIGEDDGGCTDSPHLWKYITSNVESISIPNWVGMHDRCWIFDLS